MWPEHLKLQAQTSSTISEINSLPENALESEEVFASVGADVCNGIEETRPLLNDTGKGDMGFDRDALLKKVGDAKSSGRKLSGPSRHSGRKVRKGEKKGKKVCFYGICSVSGPHSNACLCCNGPCACCTST
jgi:hypothetical protein